MNTWRASSSARVKEITAINKLPRYHPQYSEFTLNLAKARGGTEFIPWSSLFIINTFSQPLANAASPLHFFATLFCSSLQVEL